MLVDGLGGVDEITGGGVLRQVTEQGRNAVFQMNAAVAKQILKALTGPDPRRRRLAVPERPAVGRVRLTASPGRRAGPRGPVARAPAVPEKGHRSG